MQTPASSFQDKDLRNGRPLLNALGLPKPACGAFASVYRMISDNRSWAVRCFLHDVPDQQARYLQTSRFVCADDLPYTVDCEYLDQGILVRGQWFPVLKMEWVEGLTLTEYIDKHFQNHSLMKALTENFQQMLVALTISGIAHGDLQHGNLMVLDNGQLRLVDYDGMYVPQLEGFESNELGHRNYQHPARSKRHFGPDLDNFSAWVIYASLLAITYDWRLWKGLGAGDECLLFKQADFMRPTRSHTFYKLENHPAGEIRLAARLLRSFLLVDPAAVPALDADLEPPENLPPIEPEYAAAPPAPPTPVRKEPALRRVPHLADLVRDGSVTRVPPPHMVKSASPTHWLVKDFQNYGVGMVVVGFNLLLFLFGLLASLYATLIHH